MDFRYGAIGHPAGGIRYGSVNHSLLTERVIYTEGTYRPGDLVTVHLVGLFDIGSFVIRLGGVTVATPFATESAAYFTMPALHTAANYDMLNYGTLSVEFEDATGVVTTTVTAAPPNGTTYLPSITGSPWSNPSSVFFTSTGLVNGDSALIVTNSGGPILEASSDGQLVLANPGTFTVYPYSQEFGWGALGDFQVTIGVGIVFIPSPIYRGQTGVKIIGFGFGV